MYPSALWYVGLDFVIGKLYANSLLATLNTRYSLRGRAAAIGSQSDDSDLESPRELRLGGGIDNRTGGLVLSTVIQVRLSSASRRRCCSDLVVRRRWIRGVYMTMGRL